MKRRLQCMILILAVSGLLNLSGCGVDHRAELAGRWTGTLDRGAALSAALKEELLRMDAPMAEHIRFQSFRIPVVYTFQEDGTYRIEVDTSQLPELFRELKQELAAGFTAYMETVIQEAGLEVSVEELLAATGNRLEDLIEEAFPDGLLEQFVTEMTASVTGKGTFSADGISLTFLNQESDAQKLTQYVLGEETLTLTGPEATVEKTDIYPLVLRREMETGMPPA